jgi:hypothetical protein
MATVRKRLKDADETDGNGLEHHSCAGVLAMCHAEAGGDHNDEDVDEGDE